MKKITSYKQYQEVEQLCFVIRKVQGFPTEGKTEEQLQNRNDFLKPKFDKLADLGFTYEEAEEALAHDKEQYERITKDASDKSVNAWKRSINDAWETGTSGADAAAVADHFSWEPEYYKWV